MIPCKSKETFAPESTKAPGSDLPGSTSIRKHEEEKNKLGPLPGTSHPRKLLHPSRDKTPFSPPKQGEDSFGPFTPSPAARAPGQSHSFSTVYATPLIKSHSFPPTMPKKASTFSPYQFWQSVSSLSQDYRSYDELNNSHSRKKPDSPDTPSGPEEFSFEELFTPAYDAPPSPKKQYPRTPKGKDECVSGFFR